MSHVTFPCARDVHLLCSTSAWSNLITRILFFFGAGYQMFLFQQLDCHKTQKWIFFFVTQIAGNIAYSEPPHCLCCGFPLVPRCNMFKSPHSLRSPSQPVPRRVAQHRPNIYRHRYLLARPLVCKNVCMCTGRLSLCSSVWQMLFSLGETFTLCWMPTCRNVISKGTCF